MPGSVRVYLTSLGCRLNEAEIARWGRDLGHAGHQVVPSPTEAQLFIVNTCAVTAEAARKSRKLVRGLHRQNPAAPVVLSGCYGDLEPAAAASLAGVDFVVANRDKERLVPLLCEALALQPAASPASPDKRPPGGRTRAFVKVQDGCRNRCAFCVVTLARGEERSRAVADVVAEVNHLSESGYREVVLTGVHLGGYGSDLDADLEHLVAALLAQTDIPRLRLSSLEPWDLDASFWRLWESRRLLPHVHLPLQSGSDSVLRRMARRCSTEAYARLVAAARAQIPDLTVTTDLLVGFPGESDREWTETLEFVQGIGFGDVHIFAFSPRAGTKAARMADQVPTPIKRARRQQMQAVAAAMTRAHRRRFLGQSRPVLWEQAGPPCPSGLRAWFGYSDNYLPVKMEAPAHVDLRNRITLANLVAVGDDRHAHLEATAASNGFCPSRSPAAATETPWGAKEADN